MTVIAGKNVKQDWVLPYGGTRVLGPTAASSVGLNVFRVEPVLGASGYEWASMRWDAFTGVEGAEDGGVRFQFSGLEGWDPVKLGTPASGTRSFQLVHTNGLDQILQFQPKIRPSTGAEIRFKSFLGYTTTNQIATAEVSTNGIEWTVLLRERGRGISVTPNGSYVAKSVSLAAWVGVELRVRFRFFVEPVEGARFYSQTQPSFGWSLDDLQFTNSQVGTEPATHSLAVGEPFVFKGGLGKTMSSRPVPASEARCCPTRFRWLCGFHQRPLPPERWWSRESAGMSPAKWSLILHSPRVLRASGCSKGALHSRKRGKRFPELVWWTAAPGGSVGFIRHRSEISSIE